MLPAATLAGNVRDLQAALLGAPETHIHIIPSHTFAHGLYAREVTLPAGSVAIGHAHAQEHICFITRGRAQVVSEEGVTEVVAPVMLVVPAGRKNCVHALEETVWTTVHASDAKTVEEAEETLILPETVNGEVLPLPHKEAQKWLS